jgi:putative membrane protein insertion efficiency factor
MAMATGDAGTTVGGPPGRSRRTWGARATGLPRRAVVGLLRLYQRVVSPFYGPTCRFYPSCSQYALVAVERHGVVRGAGLAAWRLLRCNPWNAGGVDDVPPVRGQDEPGTPGTATARRPHADHQQTTSTEQGPARAPRLDDRREGTHRWTS